MELEKKNEEDMSGFFDLTFFCVCLFLIYILFESFLTVFLPSFVTQQGALIASCNSF